MGSEMCIRDRAQSVGGAAGGVFHQHNQGNPELFDRDSVEFTNLFGGQNGGASGGLLDIQDVGFWIFKTILF